MQMTKQIDRPGLDSTGGIISRGQVVTALVVCQLPALLWGLEDSGGGQLWAVLVAGVLRLLLVLPLYLAFGRGWYLSSRSCRGVGEGVFRWLAAGYLVLFVGSTLAQTGLFLTDTLYAGGSVFFFGLVLLVLAVYGAHMGLEAAARSALPVLVVFLVGLLLTAAGVRDEIRLIHLVPAGSDSWLMAGIQMAGHTPELLLLLMAAPRGGAVSARFSTPLLAFGITTGLAALVSFLCGSVLGSLQTTVSYPFFRVESLMSLSVFRRLDAAFAGIWLVILLLRCLFLLWTAEQLLSPFSGKRRRWLLPFLGCGSLAVLALLIRRDVLAAGLGQICAGIWWVPLLCVGVLLLWRGRKEVRS